MIIVNTIMKGKVYCLSNTSLKDIYMIGTDIFPEEKLLKEIKDKNITSVFKNEYSVECNNAITKERTIRKLLKEYRYEKKKRFFKIDLETIIKIFKDLDKLDEIEKDLLVSGTFNSKEVLLLRIENLKIQNVVKYINENIEFLIPESNNTSIKIDVLFDEYIVYCKKENISTKLRAGICDFEKICEKHTRVGKLNDYCEFNFIKFKR